MTINKLSIRAKHLLLISALFLSTSCGYMYNNGVKKDGLRIYQKPYAFLDNYSREHSNKNLPNDLKNIVISYVVDDNEILASLTKILSEVDNYSFNERYLWCFSQKTKSQYLAEADEFICRLLKYPFYTNKTKKNFSLCLSKYPHLDSYQMLIKNPKDNFEDQKTYENFKILHTKNYLESIGLSKDFINKIENSFFLKYRLDLDINQYVYGYTLLHLAAFSGDIDNYKSIRKEGADPYLLTLRSRFSVLVIAANGSNHDFIKALSVYESEDIRHDLGELLDINNWNALIHYIKASGTVTSRVKDLIDKFRCSLTIKIDGYSVWYYIAKVVWTDSKFQFDNFLKFPIEKLGYKPPNDLIEAINENPDTIPSINDINKSTTGGPSRIALIEYILMHNEPLISDILGSLYYQNKVDMLLGIVVIFLVISMVILYIFG